MYSEQYPMNSRDFSPEHRQYTALGGARKHQTPRPRVIHSSWHNEIKSLNDHIVNLSKQLEVWQSTLRRGAISVRESLNRRLRNETSISLIGIIWFKNLTQIIDRATVLYDKRIFEVQNPASESLPSFTRVSAAAVSTVCQHLPAAYPVEAAAASLQPPQLNRCIHFNNDDIAKRS